MTTENNVQDQINAALVRGLGEISATMKKIDQSLQQQNAALTHTPDKRWSVRIQAAAVGFVVAVVMTSTWITYTGQQDAQRVGQQNQQTVTVYCAAVPNNTECTTPGSVTAKAGAILANCRIFSNLAAAAPQNAEAAKLLPSYAGCKALNF